MGLFEAFQRAPTDALWTYLPFGPFANFDEFLPLLVQFEAAKDPHFYTILAGHGAPLGIASLMRIKPKEGSIEVGGIAYSPALQRTPAATEAMSLLMAYAFEDLGYRRYEWKCDALNAPSRRAAERLGFSFEGVFRQALVYKGRNRDTAWFSITDGEWPRLKAAQEAWLKPENFDDEGRQKSKLGSGS
jgi:RimJ/RimL family protein N-acetyltransferase